MKLNRKNISLFGFLAYAASSLGCASQNIKDKFEAKLGINNFRNCVTLLTPTYEDKRLEFILNNINIPRSFLQEVNNINGKKLSLNDLSILEVLYNDPAMYKQFKDRPYLEARLSKIVDLTRKKWPKYYSVEYPLKDISNINLLKAILLEESIKKNKYYLINIIQRDSEDKNTEYGGLFKYKNNKLTPVEYRPDTVIADYKYVAPFDQNFTGGIVPFHIHANGSIGPSVGDLLHSLTYSVESVVMGLEDEKLQAIFYSSLTSCGETKPEYFVLNIGSF